MATHPSWHRTALSRQLCRLWNWRRADGQLKDMACRTMLLKLQDRGLIKLPKPAGKAYNHRRGRTIPDVLHSTDPIESSLRELRPVRLMNVRASNGFDEDLFNCLLCRYHYLGFRTPVGQTMKYLALDRQDRPLGCLLFGSSAWKVRDRDEFIGWDRTARERNLNRTTNNTRFLILPWVRVKHLASHVLSLSLKQLGEDWECAYGHQPVLVETFVDVSRFRGTCYKAANWQLVGRTSGRTRQDRSHTISQPAKDIYVYPLTASFREELSK